MLTKRSLALNSTPLAPYTKSAQKLGLRGFCNYNQMVEQTKDAEELVKHVDENNKDIGGVTRSRMRKENLWHRASFIFVINTSNELLVQKRTMIKDYCPGFYDLASAGGVVDAGEDDDVSAERELEEELGLIGYKLSKLFTFKHEVADNRVFGNFYIVSGFDPEKQKLVLQESEV